jgi:uncharacterized protein (TIGR02117 family)
MLGVLGFVAAYFVGFWLIGMVPVNTDHVEPREGIPIWIRHGGVHVSFVVPIQDEVHDWRREFAAAHFDYVPPEATHVLIGWGDRGFYLETPEWADLRCGTALRAVSYCGRAAMHAVLIPFPATSDWQRRVVLTPPQYRRLVDYVRASLARDTEGRVRPIAGVHYGDDAFYEAVGTYGLFHTCNTWVNRGLSRIGVRTALWAVFGSSVMRHLPLPE